MIYEVYLGVAEACQDLIIYAVGGSAVAPLKERYVKIWMLFTTSNDETFTGKIVC